MRRTQQDLTDPEQSGVSARTHRISTPQSKPENSPNRNSPMTSRPNSTRMLTAGSSYNRNNGPKGNVANLSASPGRTPQTRRRELTLQHQASTESRYSSSPSNSPRTTTAPKSQSSTSAQNKKLRKQDNDTSTRKSSTVSHRESPNSRSSRKTSNNPGKRLSRISPPSLLESEGNDRSLSKVIRREKTKFDHLWDCKTIEHGLIRIPPQKLEELISKEDINTFYDVDETPVASGLFATVRKCTHRETGVTYAAKFSSRVRCNIDCSMEILHEIAMLSACADSNRIVHLTDVFENKHEIILVLEYAPGGDFQSVLDEDMVPFEEDVQGFLRQILEALEYIHEKNIAHLDIKPQNIVLMGQFPNCEIKLCDLEVARVIQNSEDIREIIGTPDYVAPEILTLDPITLAADIWSLGVVAYVLLTGFSPFGGDTDQETLRNITTAELDFPDELFEGVSEDAKSFVATCLDRDPKKRPTVKECLQHPWLAQEAEPPSPSPLMLKIPTPDPITEPIHYTGGGHSGHGGPGHLGSGSLGGTRRSCQTCRDKITERKRYLSKSREAIFEKVANSNLKKSLSKSRERLCDMRLTLSKSRDNLSEAKTAAVRSQDKFYGFKSLSKSQEVLSASLGGAMKRMVNGAVSDITQAFLGNAITERNGLDLVVLVPGGSIVVSSPINLFRVNSMSMQMLQKSPEMIRKPPVIQCTPAEQEVHSPKTIEPLIEVSEEEEDPSRLSAVQQIKESQEKEVKVQDKPSTAEQEVTEPTIQMASNENSPPEGVTVEVQASSETDISKPTTTASLRHKLADKADLYMDPENLIIQTVTRRHSKEPRRRGFSHDNTLGEENHNQAWRQELDKIRSQRQLKVSELIGSFNRQEPPINNNNNESDATVKQRRRASLQIHFDPSTNDNVSKDEKAERRKSTSSILTNNIENLKIQDQITEILHAAQTPPNPPNVAETENKHELEAEVPKDSGELPNPPRKNSYLDKVAQRKKNWEYFEINHPKAISDQRLQQLKAKYQKRKTVDNFVTKANPVSIAEENEEESSTPVPTCKPETKPTVIADSTPVSRPTVRSQSVPMFSLDPSKHAGGNLDLSVDPFTGLCLGPRSTETLQNDTKPSKTDNDNNRAVRTARRKSSHLADIQEQSMIPEEKILEVRIDPLTSQIETVEIARTFSPKKYPEKDSEKRRRLSVEIIPPGTYKNHLDDDGFGSLPHTPTEFLMSPPAPQQNLSVSQNTRLDDGIFTSSEEILDQQNLSDHSGNRQSKTSASLDGDTDRASVISWGDEIRPASAQANPISRMCTGAFSRAIVKFGDHATSHHLDADLVRRQSSPVFRLPTN